MADAKDWLIMAEENARAGEHLRGRERYRASTSRFYYAAFQAAHAVLFTAPLRASAPLRGNWDHGPLANALKDCAIKHMGYDEPKGETLRKRLVAAMLARVDADYGAGVLLDQESLDAAQRAATEMISLAYRHGAGGRKPGASHERFHQDPGDA